MAERIKSTFTQQNTSISDLKCTICENPLSVAPIYCRDSNHTETVCGRCAGQVTTIYGVFTRQTAYEEFAKKMVFSCMFKPEGCENQLKWNEVELHESLCPFRFWMCPMFIKENHCEFQITSYESLIDHAKLSHEVSSHAKSKITMQLETQIKVLNSNQGIIFVIVYKDEIEQILYCDVMSKNFTEMYYKVEIFGETGESMLWPTRNVNNYSHNFMERKSYKKGMGSNWNLIRQFLGNPSYVNIEFKRKNPRFSESMTEAKLQQEINFKLHCDSCSEMIIPPLYKLSGTDENLCNDCLRIRKEKNPYHRASTRNHNLEKVILCKKFLCEIDRNSKIRGCIFPYCTWKGKINDFSDHLNGYSHTFSILNESYDLDFYYLNSTAPPRIYRFNDELFIFRIEYNCKGYLLKVTCLGKSYFKYKYEIELFRLKSRNIKIGLSHITDPELPLEETSGCERQEVEDQQNIFVTNTFLEQVFFSDFC
ncbi:hypothetical protein HHI36_002175 [Cryptolaemus montrouzieri]|uniref:SIAH-type domain-containing protein n=1 Tax=Cryptolaemus montrouzieri TaxID=559131 RepID=A0ABD2PAF6_9CUCU